MSLEQIATEARAELEQPQTREGEYIPGAESSGPAPGPSEADKLEAEARQWSALPFLFGSIVSRALPELRDVYTDTACLAWGRLMVPVARKYGWSLLGLEQEAALLVATWQFIGPTWDALKRKRATQNAKESKPDAPQAEAPAPKPEAAEHPLHPDGSPS